MTYLPIPFLFIGLFAFADTAFGQAQKSEQQLKSYLLRLKASKVDTILIVKSGCSGCYIKYSDTSIPVNGGQDVYVLTKNARQFNLAYFDDLNRQRSFTFDSCSLFDTIQYYKLILKQKENFYKKELAELRKTKFFPPGPVHYSYEELVIKIPSFSYSFMVVEEKFDRFGFSREDEPWFKARQNIINRLFQFIKITHG